MEAHQDQRLASAMIALALAALESVIRVRNIEDLPEAALAPLAEAENVLKALIQVAEEAKSEVISEP